MPALYKKVKEGKESVSFESICLPGFFMRQRNYHFYLEQRDGSELFGKFERKHRYVLLNEIKLLVV